MARLQKRSLKAFVCLAMLAASIVALAPPASASPVFYCDINGDLFSDFPIGTPNENWNATNDGIVDVVYGGPNGAAGVEGVIRNNPSKGDKLGSTMMCADLNADGFQDLVMGIPFANTNGRRDSGEVLIVYGSAAGLDFGVQETITQATPGVADRPQIEDLFGYELMFADFNNDGFPDLVVSAPGEDVGGAEHAGIVHILYSSSQGLLDANGVASGRIVHQNSRGILDRAQAEDFFGVALAAADFDGDGQQDLAVGVPLEDVNGKVDAGAINVIYGNANGLSKRDQFLHQDRKSVDGVAEAFDGFGAPIFATQLVGRSFLSCATVLCSFDLIIGVPGEDLGRTPNAGILQLIPGSTDGLRGRDGEVWHRNSRGISARASAGDEFGHSVATGFFNDDLILDVAVGVPGDNIGGKNDAGSVHLIFGDGNGLSKADKIISLNSTGVPGRARAEDRFGSTVAVGAFFGTLRSDIAIGIPLKNVNGRRDAGAVLLLRGGSSGLNGQDARLIDQGDFGYLPAPRPNTGDNFGNFNAALPGFRGNSAAGELVGTTSDTVDPGPSTAATTGRGGVR